MPTAAAKSAPSTDVAWASTLPGDESAVPAPRRAMSGSAFDVCHVGVVLRAMLLVHGAAGVGVAFVASNATDWLLRVATVSIAIVPALLLWLVGTCAASARLMRAATAVQWAVPVAWGALCAVLGHGLLAMLSADPVPFARGVAAATAGAGTAAAFVAWLRDRARREQPAAAAARLAQLQSRIRPHFLFNTLNSAIVLVRLDPARAEAVLEDLSELFRAALAGGDEHLSTTLRDEVELARRYLEIERVRFGDRLRVEWELDPHADGAKLPPLLLQPLVENAVRHGIEPMPGGGLVLVSTRARHGVAEIVVRNPVGDARTQAPRHGLALRNARERLKLMHDVAADFRIQQGDGRFEVRIVVPLSA
ncbi:sensor histidine kinase [Caldimonas sp. KR1-144]|uniref:sensor histidine kinase n=1 Tax=Caldimonas sp. KR1-144 TaxID=3400911 RepID=UPI003C04D4BB